MSDPARLSAQMNGMSISNPSAEGHYYPQPAPGYGAAASGYPAPAGYPPAGYPPSGPELGHHGPVAIGSGWTAEAVKPESAQPGQNTAGHYGHLQ
jgi:hypothetical protein